VELGELGFGEEIHHALDAGAVVPGTVEQHDLAARREMLHLGRIFSHGRST
jgi:hypothetical protein